MNEINAFIRRGQTYSSLSFHHIKAQREVYSVHEEEGIHKEHTNAGIVISDFQFPEL